MKSLRDIILPVIGDMRVGKSIEVSELWGASKALFLCGLSREATGPIIIITATEDAAETLVEDLRFFFDTIPHDKASFRQEIHLFPAWGVLPFEADSPDSRTVGERMRFLYNLISKKTGIYIVSAGALLQKLPPWELFVESVQTIRITAKLDPNSLARRLVEVGYEMSSLVTRIGESSRRGGIIDFFSPLHEHPVRIEFFGDTIESMRLFDIETQRSLSEIKETVVLPVRELITTEAGVENFKKRINRAVCDYGESPESNERRNSLLSEIKHGTLPPGGEFLAPFFYDMVSLFQYVPHDSWIVLVEPDDITKQIDELAMKIDKGRREEIDEGRILPEITEFYDNNQSIAAELAKYTVFSLLILGTGGSYRMDTKSAAWMGVRLTKLVERNVRTAGPIEGAMDNLIEKLRRLRDSNRVVLVCGTEEATVRLKNLFTDAGLGVIPSTKISWQDSGPSPVVAIVGRLSEGFLWQEIGLAIVTEEEIFGKKIHRSVISKPSIAPFLSSFKELRPGDFVVHTDYGVGEYQGLTHINIDSFETDFLTLRYELDVKLHVPLYSLDKVQKYFGIEGSVPKLDRLGAPAWLKTKEKIKKDILAMAQDLVNIYAARESHSRTPYTAPDNLYREFESAFPYEETPDQQKAIEDVLADMQRPRPMDRLVCGDVGYGKTEVALRAAFKAVEDGMQAAVLVPTTLLADQHYRTLLRRCEPFSIHVDMLSRFRTRAEQQETLKGLKRGTVDIVVGTHRLLQKDVVFKNLGLLVVDEEHKFGVRHKEKIKELKKLVDVLTLTATPIPRTLHMSLSGIRDLSIIQTPPLDRQAIHVVLARFGKRVIREAIMQEVERGGQVFFVHNRVQGIERMADFIRQLVPEAQVGIAHGQLKENEIEDVMSQFITGTLNVLVTTTIIESGIDIPTANTIIINRADRFGLADLYQIKGRVGRSREKAYAYLLAPAEEALSDVARKRLRAIQELSELGAGFRIAAQDLETRGAGNLLGKQQSGHISAVGIDLYTQMMEEAMAQLRGEEITQEPDTIINVRASAFIPEDYISDVSLRLAAYKEISSASDEAQLRDIEDEIRDRYGELPGQLANLFQIMSVKIIAKKARVGRIDAGKHHLTITFAESANISPNRVMILIKKNKGNVKLTSEYTLQVALPDESLRTASETVKKCLQELL